MKLYIVAGTAGLALLSFSAGARPVPTKQASMSGGVRAVFDADSKKPTVYGAIISLTFTKQDAGKMLEVAADSPKPVSIEMWSGDIARGATTWDKSRQFLGNSGRAPELKPSFKWMIEPGNYTALVLATLPPGQKPDPFVISWGKEVRTPTEQDKKEWNLAMARLTVNRVEVSRSKRTYAPNFTAFATDRNPVSPSQYRGKTLLIHFFSGSDQEVQEDIGYNQGIYQRLHDQGFEMIDVCMDTEQTGFDAVVAQFSPEWRLIYDGRTGNSAIVEKYGIGEGSVDNYLIDAAGKIVAHGLRREALAKMVVATINEQKAYTDALKLVDESPEVPDPAAPKAPEAAAK